MVSLGYRPVTLGTHGRSRRRSDMGSTNRAVSAPAQSGDAAVSSSSAFPEVAWLFAVLSLPPRLDESGLRECLRQLERRFEGRRVPDSYVAGVRQTAALLVARAAGRSEGKEAVPLLDVDQRLVMSNEMLNVDAPHLMDGIDRASSLFKLTNRSSSGLSDAELTHLGCLRARAVVSERLPPGFCPEPLSSCEAERVVMSIRSDAFKEGLRRLFVHCSLSDELSPAELAFLNNVQVTVVRDLPLRLMFKGQDVTRPNRAGGIHHLEGNTVYMCSRDAAPFSKLLPALAFRLRQGLCQAGGRPAASIRQHILVAMLRQEDPEKLPALVDDLISSESPDRVRSPKRRACVALSSTPTAFKTDFDIPLALEGSKGGISLLRKFGDVAKDLGDARDCHAFASENIVANVSLSVDPVDRESE